jgi:hypothetical protein
VLTVKLIVGRGKDWREKERGKEIRNDKLKKEKIKGLGMIN